MNLGVHLIWWLASSILFICNVEAGTEAEIIAALDEAAEEGTWGYVPLSGPYIDKNMSRNVTGQKGKTAVLNCRILYIVGKTVSWMRTRDLHLLTVGRFTYTSDDRFRAVHQQGSDDWLLKIHYLQDRDQGAYECQVSTTPPMSLTLYLEVLNPTTWIVGGPDLYINIGSTINLTCEVKFTPEPPPYIFWYHNDRILSYAKPKGITVLTEHAEQSSVSRLIIEKAESSHSGRYNCSPATAPSHFINVHIIPTKDEQPAAIHHKNTTSSSSSSTSASNVASMPGSDIDIKSGKGRNTSLSSLHYPLAPSIGSRPSSWKTTAVFSFILCYIFLPSSFFHVGT